MVSLRERYTVNWDVLLINCILVGVSTQVYTEVFEHHKFYFDRTAKYLIHCQLMRDNGRGGEGATNKNLQAAHLVVRGVIV